MQNRPYNYNLNLAQRPFVNTTVPMVIAAVVVAGIISFTAFNAIVLVSAESDQQGYREDFSSAEARIEDLRGQINLIDENLSRMDFQELRREVIYANALITRRSMSWTRLFDRLEELAPAELRMLRISPNVSADAIDMSWRVEVPNQEVIRRFINALEASPNFEDIELISENPGPDENSIIWEMNLLYVEEQ